MVVTSPSVDAAQDTGVWGMARRLLPSAAWGWLRQLRKRKREWDATRQLSRLRRRLQSVPPGSKTAVRLHGYKVRVHYGEICYCLYEDIFVNRICHFQSVRPDPLILDCGSNMGMSVLCFKHLYPHARVIGFEPDPVILP